MAKAAPTLTKREKAIAGIVDPDKTYSIAEAVDLVKKAAKAKFDESVEMHFALTIDPKQADQQIRSTAVLPHGTGKTKIVAVVAKGEKVKEAQAAGADFFGDADLIEKITKGWLGFDVLVATPDAMKDMAKLGKTLGPKGLMPNPKTGTVTFDLARTVKEIKGGRVEFRADATGNVHVIVGKVSFEKKQLEENAQTFLEALWKAKPSGVKGVYMRRATLCSTMGPGVRINSNL